MNRLCVSRLMGIFFLFAVKTVIAQDTELPATTIAPYDISVSYHQTTNLIFPYAVKSVDIGSNTVLAQKAKNVENILQLKAGTEQFTPTNISVVTDDDTFYSFVLHYTDNPSNLNISFANGGPVQLAGNLPNARLLEQEAWQVAAKRSFMHLKQNEQALNLKLNGMFYSEKNLWLKLGITNQSEVDFQPAYLRFFLRDKKQVKRTALNETEILPLFKPSLYTVKGNASSVWPVAFKPFTVPKHQRLIVQASDESGGRMIVLPIKSRFFLKAHRLP
ncbi:conjugative transposon protein TraN [Niabella ginsenosidivorans]|nr:conjugative transposon protein TraN [Niabella ginsenosidivorans]